MSSQVGLQIEAGSFAGHETFPFRYTWLRKAMDFVVSDPEGFGREDAMVELGVGKNMVRAMRHWALACGVLKEDEKSRGRSLRPSTLGRRLFSSAGWDPYLEDPATVWILHAQLASRPEWATTWYWVFNHLPQAEFTKDELAQWLLRFAADRGWKRVGDVSVRRDIDCFIRSYASSEQGRKTPIEDTLDCPLVELGLVRPLGTRGQFVISRGPQPTLPDELIAWRLNELLEHLGIATGTISLDKLAYAPGSPGRLFCLSEEALVARLERLGEVTAGAFAFDDTAGLRQVLVTRRPESDELLGRYFHRVGAGRATTRASR